MEQNKQILTIVLVLVIGLIGGYMIAEHSHGGGDRKEAHEVEGHSHDVMNDNHMMGPQDNEPTSSVERGIKDEAGAEVHVQ